MKDAAPIIPLLVGVGVGVGTGNPALGFAAASAAGSAVGGIAQAGAFDDAGQMEAEQLKLQREREKINATARAAEIRSEMRRRLGAQRAALASRGINPDDTFGTAGRLAGDTVAGARSDLLMSDANFAASRDSLNLARDQARYTARQRGQAALYGGFVDAATTVASTAYSMKRIGTPFKRTGYTAGVPSGNGRLVGGV